MNTTLLCLCFQISMLIFISEPVITIRDTGVSPKSALMTVVDFSGEGSYEVFPGTKWQFFGPVRTVSVVEGQKIIATGAAVLGTRSGTTRAAIAICHQASSNAPIAPFVADNHLNVEIDAVSRPYTASGTAALSPGTYTVGYCLVNSGREVIGRNNYVNGWAMTTD